MAQLFGPQSGRNNHRFRALNRSAHEHLLWTKQADGSYVPADGFVALVIERGLLKP